jgi:hypothetical protein
MVARLSPNATTTQINKFLAQLRISSWRVHPRIVEFNNALDRNKKITQLYNKLVNEGLPQAAAESQANELKEADVLSVGIKSLAQAGSILMCCGDWEKDLQQEKSSDEAIKHVVLVFLKYKKVNSLLTYFYNVTN